MPKMTYAQKWSITSKNLREMGIYKKIVDYAELSPHHNIIDLGCGTGELLRELCKRLDLSSSLVVGIDYEKEALEIAQDNLRKDGYEVSLTYNPRPLRHKIIERKKGKPEVIEQIYFDNIFTNLNLGEVNLIGDYYGYSNYPYLYGHELDRVFLTFRGGRLIHPIREDTLISRTMNDMNVFMKDDALFLYVDKEISLPGKYSAPDAILLSTDVFKLEDSLFVKSFNDFVASVFPNQWQFSFGLVDSSEPTTVFVIEPEATLEETVKKYKGYFKRLKGEWGIIYCKFKKK